MSTVIREAEFTAGMSRKARRHLAAIRETTPGLRLVHPETGELRPNAVHWLTVPSDSRPPLTWDLRVSWGRRRVRAWHHRDACPAYELTGRCWHLFAAAQKIADRWHDGTVPDPGPLPGTVPDNQARVPAAAAVGFYD